MGDLLITGDGSHSLRHETIGELYHSERGAVGESMHIFIEAGLRYLIRERELERLSIFEMGFGTGLNCYLTLDNSPISIDYHALEAYPIAIQKAKGLNYIMDDNRSLFNLLHSLSWNDPHRLSDSFMLTKYHACLETFDFEPLRERFDLIYFDAFSPDVQPELWTVEVMRNMFAILHSGGVLVTYSAKGAVKEALRAAGFVVTRLPGALGKRHMVRAVKP